MGERGGGPNSKQNPSGIVMKCQKSQEINIMYSTYDLITAKL